MKNLAILAASLLCGLSFDAFAQAQATAVQGSAVQGSAAHRIRAQLIDGSQILGVTPTESIQVKLEFSELTIPLSKVRRLVWKPQSPIVRIELENEDVISGKLTSESAPVEAIFGKFDLKWEHLKSLEVIPPESAGSMPIRKGLVAYYSFDHGQESLGADDASEKFRAEVLGAKWSEEGRLGGAIEFDGKSALSVPHDDALNFTKGLTLSTWIKPSDAEHYGYAMIAGKTTGSSWSGGFGLAKMSGDRENIYFFVNSYSTTVVKAPVKDGKWTHVAGTFDGQQLTIYINGKQVETLKVRPPHEGVAVDVLPVNTPLLFGSDPSNYFWKGKLDEAALFDRALREDEILRLYEVGENQLAASKPR